MGQINYDNLREHANKIKERQKEREEKIKRYGNTFAAKEGENYIRICPPPGDTTSAFQEVLYHYNIGGNKKNRAFCTTQDTARGYCIVCDEIALLRESEHESDNKLAAMMWPRAQFMYNIVNTESDETLKQGVKQFIVSETLHNQINTLFLHFKGKGLPNWDFTQPDFSRELTLVRTGSEKQTKYTVIHDDPDILKGKLRELVLSAPLFSNLVWFYSDSELEIMLKGETIGGKDRDGTQSSRSGETGSAGTVTRRSPRTPAGT